MIPRLNSAFETRQLRYDNPKTTITKRKNTKRTRQETKQNNQNCLPPLKQQFIITKSSGIELWFNQSLTNENIITKRTNIYNKFQHYPINDQLLIDLFQHYNEEFFENKMMTKLELQQTKFEIRFGTKKDEFKKGWAAYCSLKGDYVQILFHPGLLELQFNQSHEEINGILCQDRLSVLQIILEHEIIHLLLQVFLRNTTCKHGNPFQTLAKGLFGHLLFTHAIGIVDGKERIEKELDRIEKNKICQVKDMVIYKQSKCNAMILMKTKANVTLIHEDGSIVEKVPYNMISISDNKPINFESFNYWTERFLKTKLKIKVHDVVNYLNENDIAIKGQVLQKKATHVIVGINSNFSTKIKYHCLI